MSMFHKHNWIEIARTYAPSIIENGLQMRNWRIMDKRDERAWHGVTEILWECSICQALRKEEMLGKIVEKQK